MACFRLLVGVAVAMASVIHALAIESPGSPPPLSTAREVAAYVAVDGEAPPRVELEAVVTCQDLLGTIFLRDASGVTFITDPARNPRLPRGERVRVKGKAYQGLIIGGIRAERIERLGRGEPPEPVTISPDEMLSSTRHYDWVSLTGVGRAVSSTGESAATLLLTVGGRPVEVRIESLPPVAERPDLVDARLRVVGLAAGEINDRRQLVRPYLGVQTLADIEVLAPPPASPFDGADVPFGDVASRRFAGHRVKVSGVVTAVDESGGLFLFDGDRGLFVARAPGDAATGEPLRAGDRVEAAGFPEMGPYAAFLAAAVCRKTGTAGLPSPRPLGGDMHAHSPDAEPVEAIVTVVERIDRAAGTELATTNGRYAVTIRSSERLPKAAAVGARLRARGVCRVNATRIDDYKSTPTAFELFPETAADVTILSVAPWWTPRRIGLAVATTVAVAGVAGLAAAAWILSLRRQVTTQLAVIETQLQNEAIVEERRRIAREFHDSLEQDLAGLMLRLDSAAWGSGDPEARLVLDRQRALVARLQTETRQFVWDLRDPAKAHWSFEELVAAQLAEQQEFTAVPIQLRITGAPEVPRAARYHLLRIVREAVANAIHHAGATTIDVTITASSAPDGRVEVTVADDGVGFDAEACEQLAGHFGLRGMRERARRIDAEFTIEPRSGGGSRVVVVV